MTPDENPNDPAPKTLPIDQGSGKGPTESPDKASRESSAKTAGPQAAARGNAEDDDEEETPFTLTLPDDPAAANDWYLWAGLLVLLVGIVYWPAIGGGFIWDDGNHVSNNPNLETVDGLAKIWLDPRSEPQYYPLTHTSFWLEYQAWGKNPLGFHIDNLILHALSVVLVWRILKRLKAPGAWLAAAIWAAHPLQTESVAWISERKNILSGILFFASIWFYLDFVGIYGLRDGAGEDEKPIQWFKDKWGAYGAALAFFVAAMFSKTVACAMPPAMVLILWQQRKLTREALIGLIPFFAIGLALGLFTAYLEVGSYGIEHAVGSDWDYSFLQRVLIAAHALWFYVGKLVLPMNLTFISYPKWTVSAGDPLGWVYVLGVLAVLGGLWAAQVKIGRTPFAAAMWFCVCLFPSLGFFNIYPMRYSFVSDHYQYLAGLGLIVLAVSGLAKWAGQFIAASGGSASGVSVGASGDVSGDASTGAVATPSPTAAPVAEPISPAAWGVVGASLAVLAAFGAITWMQSQIYYDQPTLWQDTLAKNPQSWMAAYNLGVEYVKIADADLAAQDPDSARDDLKQALALYDLTLQLRPNHDNVHVSRGYALMTLGQIDHRLSLEPRTADAGATRPSPSDMQQQGASDASTTRPSASDLQQESVADTRQAETEFRTAIAQSQEKAKEASPDSGYVESPLPYMFLGELLIGKQRDEEKAGDMKAAAATDDEAAGYLKTAAAIVDQPNPRTGELAPATLRYKPHYLLAECYGRQASRLMPAVNDARRALAADPKSPRAKADYDKLLKSVIAGWDNAVAEAIAAAAANSDSQEPLLRYGKFLEQRAAVEPDKMKRRSIYDEAEHQLALYCKSFPGDAEGWLELGICKATNDPSDKALLIAGEYVVEAEKLNPNYKEAQETAADIKMMMEARMARRRAAAATNPTTDAAVGAATMPSTQAAGPVTTPASGN